VPRWPTRAATLRRVVATALLCVELLIAARTVWGPPVGDAAGTGTANPGGAILVGFASPKRRKKEFLPGLVMSMR
jgi:hypothetical protein